MSRSIRTGRVPFIITFLTPPLALYVVFVLSPFAQGIQISLTDWTGLSSAFDYVGLDNYRSLFADDAWWHAVLNNLKLLLVIPAVTLALALLFATLVTRGGAATAARSRIFAAGFYRVLFFFPVVVPAVVIGILFQFVYSPSEGLLQQVLRWVGVDLLELIPGGPIGNQHVILWAIGFVVIWAGVGFYMVLFMAGMQQIPKDLFEAAAIDGAGRIRAFFSITLPLLWGHLQVALVYIGIQTLDMFALVSVMARNGETSNFGADVMATRLYTTAFEGNALFGYAAAMGTMMLVFSMFFAFITFRLTRRERIEF